MIDDGINKETYIHSRTLFFPHFFKEGRAGNCVGAYQSRRDIATALWRFLAEVEPVGSPGFVSMNHSHQRCLQFDRNTAKSQLQF